MSNNTNENPPLALQHNEVHVWSASLDLSEDQFRCLERTISAGERAHAGQFRVLSHRRRFVAARGVLRGILATYLRCRPSSLSFTNSSFGKPVLKGELLNFNLSHSGDVAVCAVAEREVGVDVERIQPELAQPWIAEQFFTPEEARHIRALPLQQRCQQFFECWTRKEALLKAMGLGFSRPKADSTAEDASRWATRTLPISAGCAAAVAAKGSDWRVLSFRWSAEFSHAFLA
jgi:4'-phosphopantetheinyl transferase